MADDVDRRYEGDYPPQEAQTMRLQDLWAQSRPSDGTGEVPLGGGDPTPRKIMQPTGVDEVVYVKLLRP